MPFSNSIVGGGGNLVRDSVQSPDFLDGVTGWQIRKDGTATFRNVTIGSSGHGVVITPDEILLYDTGGNLDGRLASTPGSPGAQFWLQEMKLGGNTFLREVSNRFEVTYNSPLGHTNRLNIQSLSASLQVNNALTGTYSQVNANANNAYLTARTSTDIGASVDIHANAYIQHAIKPSTGSEQTLYTFNRDWLDIYSTDAGRNAGVRLRRLAGQGVMLYATSNPDGELGISIVGEPTFWYFNRLGEIRSVGQDSVTRYLPFAVATGGQTVTPVANTVQSVNIIFPANRFTTAPRVTLGVGATTPDRAWASHGSVTASGFTLYYFRTTNGAFNVHWTAVQERA